MSKKTIIGKVKAMFDSVSADSSEVSLMEVTTEEGVVVLVPNEGDIAVGSQINVSDAEGNEVSAPAGDYTIGESVYVLDEAGLVIEVKEVTPTEDKPTDAEVATEDKPAEAEMATEDEVVVDEVEDEEVNPLEARLDALEKAMVNIAESMSAIDTLTTKVDELAGKPADEEVKLSKSSMAPTKKTMNDKFAKLKELSKYRK